MKKNNYKNYFKNHYKYSFSERNMRDYGDWFYAQWKIIKPFLLKRKPKSCLEIGSGIGGFYQFIKNIVPTYKGLELDANAVKFANKYWHVNSFANKSLEKTTNGKFDLVVAFEVLEHMENPSQAVSKIFSLLKKNSMFIGTSPYPYVKNIYGDPTHLSVLHPENWKRLLLLSGFKKVNLLPMTFFPFIWRLNKNLNIKIPFYLPFPKFVSTCLIVAWK